MVVKPSQAVMPLHYGCPATDDDAHHSALLPALYFRSTFNPTIVSSCALRLPTPVLDVDIAKRYATREHPGSLL